MVDGMRATAHRDAAPAAGEARRRVSPLPPHDRRAAIIAATLPLLDECGMSISTRQIARAAGVAEGTLFRVFPDKNSLIAATILAADEPVEAIAALRAIPDAAGVRERMAAVIDVLGDRVTRRGRLFGLAREMLVAEGLRGDFGRALAENRERLHRAVITVIERDADRLRVPPETAARLLTALIVATNGRAHVEPASLSRAELVEVLLDGVLKADRQSSPATAGRDGAHDRDTDIDIDTDRDPTPKEPTC